VRKTHIFYLLGTIGKNVTGAEKGLKKKMKKLIEFLKTRGYDKPIEQVISFWLRRKPIQTVFWQNQRRAVRR